MNQSWAVLAGKKASEEWEAVVGGGSICLEVAGQREKHNGKARRVGQEKQRGVCGGNSGRSWLAEDSMPQPKRPTRGCSCVGYTGRGQAAGRTAAAARPALQSASGPCQAASWQQQRGLLLRRRTFACR